MASNASKRKKILFVVIGMVVLITMWALFRPELLFIHHTHNDPFPDAPDTETSQSADDKDATDSTDASNPASSSDKGGNALTSNDKRSSPSSSAEQKTPAKGSKTSP